MNMRSEVVNNEVTVRFPDSYEIMSSEELQKAYGSVTGDLWGIWDKEAHVIVTLLWQKYNGLLLAMADMKAMARKNESMAADLYRNNNYVNKGFFSEDVDGKSGEGYWFEYDVAGIRQQGASVLFKNRNTVYSLSVFARAENQEFEEILKKAVGAVNIQ